MYFCGNYMYSNGPNWEDFNIFMACGMILNSNLPTLSVTIDLCGNIYDT